MFLSEFRRLCDLLNFIFKSFLIEYSWELIFCWGLNWLFFCSPQNFTESIRVSDKKKVDKVIKVLEHTWTWIILLVPELQREFPFPGLVPKMSMSKRPWLLSSEAKCIEPLIEISVEFISCVDFGLGEFLNWRIPNNYTKKFLLLLVVKQS